MSLIFFKTYTLFIPLNHRTFQTTNHYFFAKKKALGYILLVLQGVLGSIFSLVATMTALALVQAKGWLALLKESQTSC